MNEPTVAGALLTLLGRHGVTHAFGIPGVHNLPFWSTAAPDQPRIVGVRHEQSAGYAADAVHRATRTPSAALLTTGPGAANVVTAFGEAWASGSGVIAIASDISAALRNPAGPRGLLHETFDQAGMFAAFGAQARSARTRQEAMAYTVMALREALGPPPQTGYVGVPTDVLSEPWTAAIPHIPRMPSAGPDPHGVGRLAELVRSAARPVLWLGGGVDTPAAEAAVRDLAHRCGAVVVTSFAGRGLLAGDPHTVEAPVHEREASAVLADADLLVVVGSSFDGMNTKNWRLPIPRQRVAVTFSATIENAVDLDLLVRADVEETLAALNELLPSAVRQPWVDASAVRPLLLDRLTADPRTRDGVAFVEQVDDNWPAAGAVICDMAIGGYWVAGYSRQPRPRRLQYAVGWGTLGFALPAAVGTAAVGVPTLAVCGDGGAMFALGELATYVQESLPITLLIVDDGGYGMIRFDQDVAGHPASGVDLVTPDWQSLSAAFGIACETVETVGQVGPALRRAHEANVRGEPRVVVWSARLFPPATTSPRWFEESQ